MGGRCGAQERTGARVVARPLAVAAGAALLAAAPASAAFTPGSAGLGDPFFPRAGNGGYEVAHYDLDLDYRPATGKLAATARIRARATQDLSASTSTSAA